jgi:hypothetical protein
MFGEVRSGYVKFSGVALASAPSVSPAGGAEQPTMAKIFTNCPVSGQPIDTGIEIDEESFAGLKNFVGRVFCPYCAIEHGWTKDKAWLAENGAPKT